MSALDHGSDERPLQALMKMNSAAEFFRVPLVEMSTLGTPEMAGIYTPVPEIGLEKIGISSGFLKDAGEYHRRYSKTTYFKDLISRALARIGAQVERPRILDIGSGSGNTVFPCLELFPGCQIVATDLSPVLLRILLDCVENSTSSSGSVMPVCMDATHDYYKENSFDLVIGAAILHHLIDPGEAITAAARALVPGGHAVFFEPFESGYSILGLAYAQILAQDDADSRDWAKRLHRGLEQLRGWRSGHSARTTALSQEARGMLQSLVSEYALRRGSDKSAPIFQKIDDKWLFTRSYFEARARDAGFREVITYSIFDRVRPFSRQTEVNLELSLGAVPSQLPDWAWAILDSYDRLLSAELKQEPLFDSCVILRK